ncbi:MAG: PHP domain-containing protein [Prolixibacteraceae bacterium]
MKSFRTDLHIHTVLSACADLEMSPGAIVRKAIAQNIDLIGITDHNSTLQCKLVMELAEEQGLAVLCGTEVTTREEVHCLAYFENIQTLESFQGYIDRHLPKIPYLPEHFGYQAVVDRGEKIIRMIEEYLNVGLCQSIEQVELEVHRLGGLFVPAHIERPMFGIFNQLGFVPDDLRCDAMGIMSRSVESKIRNSFRLNDDIALIKASDAHSLEEIGSGCTIFEMNEITFDEIKKALKGVDGRKTIVQ